jgi:hypothetical protein
MLKFELAGTIFKDVSLMLYVFCKHTINKEPPCLTVLNKIKMKAVEKSKLALYTALVNLAQKDPTKPQQIPAFNRLLQSMASDIEPIEAYEAQTLLSSKGVTEVKNTVLTDVKADIARLYNLMIAHAKDKEDVILLDTVKTLRNTFMASDQTAFVKNAKPIIAQVRQLQAHWADYGITEAQVSKTEAQVTLLIDHIPKVHGILGDKKQAHKDIKTSFSRLSTTMKSLETVALGFIGVDNVFYAEFEAVLATEKKKPKATVFKVILKSAESQAPVVKQFARIVGSDLAGMTNKKGALVFKFTKAGVYDLHIPLPNGEVKDIKGVEVKAHKTTTFTLLI